MSIILEQIQDKTILLTINKPASLNALNKELIKELSDSLDNISENNQIRTILITGAGEKAFVAGADIKEFKDFDSVDGGLLAQQGQEILFDKIEKFSKPVIALINGFALGGGLELAMACHFRIASSNAKMGLPEVKLGLVQGYGGTQRLPKLVGKGMAMQMILSASMINAEKALQIGLVNEICNLERLNERGFEIANTINENSPIAIANAINLINLSDKEDGFLQEIETFGSLFGTKEFIEGVSAFLEKRKPNF